MNLPAFLRIPLKVVARINDSLKTCVLAPLPFLPATVKAYLILT